MATIFCNEHPYDVPNCICPKCNAMQWERFVRAVEEMEKHERKPTEGDDRLSSKNISETPGRHIPSF